MLDKNMTVKMTNRDNGSVGYTIPDLGNLRRNYLPGETKEITVEEVIKLHNIVGGPYMLENYFVIDNVDVVNEVLNGVEPEYFYTKEDIINLLENGSLEALQDCLDFAPKGVVEMVKELAVKLEINDIAKRQAILDKTKFNVTKAIEINHLAATTDEEAPKVTGRRVAAPEVNVAVGRRSAPPEYKIVK